jgi:hypothetical protein
VNKPPIPSQYVGEDWVRMPKPRERLWGLSRTTLLELIQLGEIKSALIRKPGSLKGVRLIYIPSLSTYLRACIEDPKPKPLDVRPSPGRKRAAHTSDSQIANPS